MSGAMRFPPTVFAPRMITATLQLAVGVSMPVTVVTLVTTQRPFDEADELYYLQIIRQFPLLLEGQLMAARCQTYLDNVASFAAQLADAAGAADCDSMVGVPTTRPELLTPYLAGARSVNPSITDATGFLYRDPGAGSQSRLSFAQRQSRHELIGDVPAMQRLLVIDDFLHTGESVAHVIELFRRHMSALPHVVIAAPLWVPEKDVAKRYVG